MHWFRSFLTSTVGKKFVMALTGLSLIAFLIVHCTINGLIFFNDGGLLFDNVAHFMGTNYIVHIFEIGLFVGIILHIIQAYVIYIDNRKARPIHYVVNKKSANSNWYSRSMTLLGTLILLFLILHLYHFWFPNRFIGIGEDINGNEDLFARMVITFQDPVVVILYIAGVISLSWHLMHGFSSAFQTFGWQHKKYTPLIRGIGTAFSIVVPLIFALMPVSMYMGWIK